MKRVEARIMRKAPESKSGIFAFILSKFMPLINAFKAGNGEVGVTIPIPIFAEPDVALLIQTTLSLIRMRPPVLHLNPGFIIVGDLHGNLVNLIHVLAQHGMPPEQNYIFLGNIVNFGEFSLETIILVFALFCSYPGNIAILRGDTEAFPIQTINSLHDEIKTAYTSLHLFETFLNAFAFLPIAAIFGDRVLCTQSSTLAKYGSIRNMMQHKGPSFCDTNAEGFNGFVSDAPLPQPDVLEDFLEQNKIQMMILGGNIDETGISACCNDQVYSIATCESTGAAGIMLLTGDLKPSPVVFISNSELTRAKTIFKHVDRTIQPPDKRIVSNSPIPKPNIIIPVRSPLQSAVQKIKSSTPKPINMISNRFAPPSSSVVMQSRL